jgi:pyruvate dehydrogenase E2 component (dihydrolipoamide acetyltransferase)
MIEFKMPSLGADMEDGTLIEWRKKPGDLVKRGDIIAEIETQKGLIEIEIFEEGKVDQLLLQVGDKVKVGTTIATIDNGPDSQQIPESISELQKPEKPIETRGPFQVQPIETPAHRIKISPLARRMAEDSGIQMGDLTGTGEGGAITREDVELAISAQTSKTEKPKSPVDQSLGIRLAVAAAMAKSNREIPHYYLESRIDMRNALAWLSETNVKRSPKDRLLPIVLYIKAAALALKQCPELNAEWKDGLILKKEINIGFVVSLKAGGIIVPAIHNADQKSLDQLMADLNDLIPRARNLKLRSSELSDSTFTLTSVGESGADTLYGIIYPPQTGLIGIGRISEQPWAENGMLDVRSCVSVTLAADHRASDGLSGSRFLSAFNQFLQKPETI